MGIDVKAIAIDTTVKAKFDSCRSVAGYEVALGVIMITGITTENRIIMLGSETRVKARFFVDPIPVDILKYLALRAQLAR